MFDKTPPKVFVQASTIHGLGVFAAQDIPDGQIIEKCPLLRLDIDEKDVLLADYRFWWMEAEKRLYYVMALGYGSLYNHSNNFKISFTNALRRIILSEINTWAIDEHKIEFIENQNNEY